MAIYELLTAALNFDTIMHSSVILCGSLFSTSKERTKSAFAVTTRKLSICKFQNMSWSNCSKKHKTIKTLCLLNWFPTKINCPVANGIGDQCAIRHTAWNILKDVQGESRLGFQIREDQWSFIDFLHRTIYQCDLIVYEILYDPLPKFPPFFCMTTILSIAKFSYQSSDDRNTYLPIECFCTLQFFVHSLDFCVASGFTRRSMPSCDEDITSCEWEKNR